MWNPRKYYFNNQCSVTMFSTTVFSASRVYVLSNFIYELWSIYLSNYFLRQLFPSLIEPIHVSVRHMYLLVSGLCTTNQKYYWKKVLKSYILKSYFCRWQWTKICIWLGMSYSLNKVHDHHKNWQEEYDQRSLKVQTRRLTHKLHILFNVFAIQEYT